MKRLKNGMIIFLIGAIGLAAVIGTVLSEHFSRNITTKSYTPQEIEEMGIEPVNINTADAGELSELPGLSAKQAQSIVDYRTEHGSFTSVEELVNVKGIGKSTLDKLRIYITI